MASSAVTRRAIQLAIRPHSKRFPARQKNRLTTFVTQIVETNLAKGGLARFASACGKPMPSVLSEYVARVVECVEQEGARVQSLQDGQPAEWQRLQTLLMQRAYNFLCLVCDPSVARAEAPDFANDTCVIIFNHTYPFDVAFEAWATTILRNRILAQYTRSSDVLNCMPTRASLDAPIMTSDGNLGTLAEIVPHPFADSWVAQIEDRVMLCDALAQLQSPLQQTLIQTIYLEGGAFADFAARNKLSLQAVYNLHHRALAQLRKKLPAASPARKGGRIASINQD